MKHLLFVATVLFLIAACPSCGNNSASASTGSSSDNTATGVTATFSYNLDGTKISGGEVDAVMMNNAAFLTGSSDKDKKASFFLNDAYKDNTETFSHSLRFAIPAKTGTVTMAADDDNYSVQLFLATGEQGKYILYANENFTATVTSISASRISGTFSGKVKLVESTGTGKAELTITDGKFDIPVRDKK